MKSFANGRFIVERKLGQGQQGLVYLANDQQQQRQVAIKVLHSHAIEQLKGTQVLSQLNHPNLVQLYDIVLDNGHPCLVTEYIDGQSLPDYLQQHGPLSPLVAVQWLLQILEGLSLVEQQGLSYQGSPLHKIRLDRDGRVKLLDLTLSTQPPYCNTKLFDPEITKVDAHPLRETGSVFCCGLLLYQMLTAKGLNAESVPDMLSAIARGIAPSVFNLAIDPQLDHLLMAAFDSTAQQYTGIQALQAALQTWFTCGGPEQDDAQQYKNTFDRLLQRMQHSADFPSLSQTICAINKLNDVDGERLQNLSSVILQDFSLTNKLLKVVNSANYGQFGGSISTISRAIVILGFDSVRNLAIALLLFEHMQNKTQADRLREAVLQSFFGGVLARELGLKNDWRDVEELLICGVFQHLGRLLTLYYFYDESLKINQRELQYQESETVAAQAVLGISYRDLAAEVMHHWHFPARMTQSLRELSNVRFVPHNQTDRLRVFANLATDLLPLVTLADKKAGVHLQQVMRRYGGALTWKEATYLEVLRSAAEQYLAYLSILEIDVHSSDFVCCVRQLISEDRGGESVQMDAMQAATMPQSKEIASLQPVAGLAAGVQDITNTLLGEFKLNDVLRMILETMYRSVGFDRVLFCTRDNKSASMVARFGFGAQIERIVPLFQFKLEPVLDVFQWALSQQADVLVEDVNAKNIATRIPDWYRHLLPAQTLIVFPLVLDKKVIGLLYADKLQAKSLVIVPEQLNLLKTLRNQAILAIKQKQLSA